MDKRSTSTQLLDFYDHVYNCVDNNKQIDVIYLDFSKAFDCISHKLLLHKLRKYGISGKILAWLSTYLCDRKQRVIVEGECSSYLEVRSGVPQGSILGPLLFILFINDIFEILNDSEIKMVLYADDAKVSRVINNMYDCIKLQNALTDLVNWSNRWGMSFNPKKCSVMSFSRVNILENYTYAIRECNLNRVYEFNDLGLLVTTDLQWEKYITNCINKANKRFGFIKRCIGYGCSKNVKLICYRSLIRPLLEYCTVVWFCTNKKILVKLESIQRKVTKFILNDYQSDYKTRLILCDILPLSLRRQFLDCVFVYNSLYGLSDYIITDKLELVNIQDDINTRLRHNQDELMFKYERTNYELYNKFFTRRVINVWNKLPYNLRDTELTNQGYNTCFKRELKSWFNDYFEKHFNEDSCSWSIHCNCRNCRVY
jgi:hypothetical protein